MGTGTRPEGITSKNSRRWVCNFIVSSSTSSRRDSNRSFLLCRQRRAASRLRSNLPRGHPRHLKVHHKHCNRQSAGSRTASGGAPTRQSTTQQTRARKGGWTGVRTRRSYLRSRFSSSVSVPTSVALLDLCNGSDALLMTPVALLDDSGGGGAGGAAACGRRRPVDDVTAGAGGAATGSTASGSSAFHASGNMFRSASLGSGSGSGTPSSPPARGVNMSASWEMSNPTANNAENSSAGTFWKPSARSIP